MNERIRELIRQTDFIDTELLTEPQTIMLEKFAELIVRECSLFVFKQNGPKSALNLLEHFGVEE